MMDYFQLAVSQAREHANQTLLDKLQLDALRSRFKDDEEIEGRRLNYEAHVDDRREANEAWERMQEP